MIENVDDSMLAKGGIVALSVYILGWLFKKLLDKFFKDDVDKSELLTKERQELKTTVNELRIELNSLNEYIRTEHKTTIERNSMAYDNMCESHKQLCVVITDLSENMKKRRSGDTKA